MMGGMLLAPHRSFFPIYARALGHSAAAISLLATARLVLAMVASLVGGTLCDSLGRKWTLLLGNIGFVAGSLVFMVRPVGWIGVLWAISGFGMGLRTLGSQSYLMDVAAPSYLGVLTAMYNWGYTLGGVLSSPLVGIVLERWDYSAFGGSLTVFAALAVGVNAILLPRSSARIKGTGGLWRSLSGYADIARRGPVLLLVLLRCLPTVYWGMAIVFIPLLLDDAAPNKMTVAWYATVSQIAASLAQVIVGHIADRVGSKWPTVAVFAVLVVSIVGTGLASQQLWGVFVFGTVGAAAAWSLSTLLPLWTARVASVNERGRILGWVHLWWNAAMIAGSVLGGALFERAPGLPFLIAGLINLGAVGCSFLFFARTAVAVGEGSG
jgi:MFS family permease